MKGLGLGVKGLAIQRFGLGLGLKKTFLSDENAHLGTF